LARQRNTIAWSISSRWSASGAEKQAETEAHPINRDIDRVASKDLRVPECGRLHLLSQRWSAAQSIGSSDTPLHRDGSRGDRACARATRLSSPETHGGHVGVPEFARSQNGSGVALSFRY